MADDRETLKGEQLTRLAQYFDEKVMSAHEYKIARGEVSRVSR